MKCNHQQNIVWSTDEQDPEGFRVTCVDCGLSVRLYPEATPPPNPKLRWGVQHWRGQMVEDAD